VGERNDRGDHDALRDVITAYGLPMAIYTDRAHWAFNPPQASGPINRRRLTQVGRALERLGIEHIPAYSPQAVRTSRSVGSCAATPAGED
jgi:hypothetical protein